MPERAAGRGAILALGVVLLVAVLTRLPTLDQPLLGIHGFRQTQTGFISLGYHEQGIDLLRSYVPVLGPPWQIPYELPILQASAAILMDLGLDAGVADRLASLMWFSASACLLWLLVRRLANDAAAVAAVTWYAFMPLTIVWSRAATIEYAALTGALAALVATIRWLDTRRSRWLLLAVVAFSVAGMVKSPTWVAWLIPIVAAIVTMGRRTSDPPRVIMLSLASILGVSAIASLAWTRYADLVKAGSVWTDWLTSTGISGFAIGSPTDRLDIMGWALIFGTVAALVLGIAGVIFLIPAARWVYSSEDRTIWLGIATLGIVPAIVFFGLHRNHEYYAIAASPAWAAWVGVGIAALLDVSIGRWRRFAAVVVLAATCLVVGSPYWTIAYRGPVDPTGVLSRADRLTALSETGDLVIIEGRDWSPEIHYSAHRHGLAVPARPLTADQWTSLQAMDPAVVELVEPEFGSARTSILTAWPWVAPLDDEFYRVAREPGALGDLPVTWTAEVPSSVQARVLGVQPMALQCGSGPLTVPASEDDEIWLVIDAPADPEARIWVADGLGPMPARGAIRVLGRPVQLRCSETAQLTVRLAT